MEEEPQNQDLQEMVATPHLGFWAFREIACASSEPAWRGSLSVWICLVLSALCRRERWTTAPTTMGNPARKEQRTQTAPIRRGSCPPHGHSSLPSSCLSSQRDPKMLRTELNLQLAVLFRRTEHVQARGGSHVCQNAVSRLPDSKLYYILDSEPRWDWFNLTGSHLMQSWHYRYCVMNF